MTSLHTSADTLIYGITTWLTVKYSYNVCELAHDWDTPAAL